MKRRIPAPCSEDQTASSNPKQAKVHAQRKFAHGSSNFVYAPTKILSQSLDCLVSSSPQTSESAISIEKEESELNNFSSLPTIDDFLTFLCFRETEVLPEKLSYLNTPQFDVPSLKSKSVKSNWVSFRNSEVKDSKVSVDKSGNKPKSALKKKNKTKVQKYTLRTRNIKNHIVRNSSHALTLKHNQRLRSKTIVNVKFSESKLKNLKNEATGIPKVISRSSYFIKNNSDLPTRTLKRKPLGDDSVYNEKTMSRENDFKRITRRHSTIDRNISLSKHCINHAIIKKNIRRKSVNRAVKKVAHPTDKEFSKVLKISLPNYKNQVTNTDADTAVTLSKPLNRSTRSASVLLPESTTTSNTNVRPSRRAKEAAALYMEMLGKQLLCPDESFEDDDNTSVESFPELPNTEEFYRREKELKEQHMKKSIGKSPSARKANTSKQKAVVKMPTPEPLSAASLAKVSNKSTPVKNESANISRDGDVKNGGLCTRSKQYKTDIPNIPAEKLAIVASSEESQSTIPLSSSSVKIIRTRLKNDIVAIVSAACTNLAQRNSCNDVFDSTKHVVGTEDHDRRGKLTRKIKHGDDINCVDSRPGILETNKKPLEMSVSTESVTIKRLLSTIKQNGDEKSKNSLKSRPKNRNKSTMKEGYNLVIPRCSSEPVIIEQLKSRSTSNSYKTIKSFVVTSINNSKNLPYHDVTECIQEKPGGKVRIHFPNATDSGRDMTCSSSNSKTNHCSNFCCTSNSNSSNCNKNEKSHNINTCSNSESINNKNSHSKVNCSASNCKNNNSSENERNDSNNAPSNFKSSKNKSSNSNDVYNTGSSKNSNSTDTDSNLGKNVHSNSSSFSKSSNSSYNKSKNIVNGRDLVIIERIPSRKNNELKSAKRNYCFSSNISSTKFKVSDAVRCATKSKSADVNQKLSIAETRSKTDNHNLCLKLSKPFAAAEVSSKKSILTSVACYSQKSITKVSNNCTSRASKLIMNSFNPVNLETAKLTSVVHDDEVAVKTPFFSAMLSFDESDDEFLVPPKLPNCIDSKLIKQTDANDRTDVSSTDDHPSQFLKKTSLQLISDNKNASLKLTTEMPMFMAEEITTCNDNLDMREEYMSKPSTHNIANPITNDMIMLDKRRTSIDCDLTNALVATSELVVPKSKGLVDDCTNHIYALNTCNDSNDENEELNVTADHVTPVKQDAITTSCNSFEINSSNIGKNCDNNNSINNNKGSLHLKKLALQSPKPLCFASSSSIKSKSGKQEKPTQSVISATQKVFNVDSKKIIFKKNSCLTSTTSSGDVKDENNAKKSEAFSLENESSVYAFEPDLPTTSPPFKRFKPVTPTKSICSSSIAVQVNFESDAKIECSDSGDTQVSSTTDCGDRVFYIPIQTSADTTSTLGVAVKLGTDGPNQKIIMSAKLITDNTTFTSSSSASTSIPSKSTFVETCCTQTPSSKIATVNNVTEKLESTSMRNRNSEKVVTSSDGIQTVQIPYNSMSLSARMNKKPFSTETKPTLQSVKIVKLNKSKKLKDLKIETSKPKISPVQTRSVKKSNSLPASNTSKVPSIPVGKILEAPTFYPSTEEFNDPLEYINTIRSVAEKYGLCRIVPPANFRPECKVVDEMRFTAYNQYVHKMLHRWGPNVKEMMVIRKYLSTQNIALTQAPLVGGMEVDLPRLYQIVQQCGGLNAVIRKKRWHQVADIMKIPKLAQDRITKLDDIYCKYLLPYDVLPHDEREKLFVEMEKEWSNHLKNPGDDEIFDDMDECIIKGRTMPLSCFYRIARNTMMMCLGNVEGQEGSSSEKIEEEFWNHVSKRKAHICVHSGSIDSGTYGYGFSVAKNSTFRKHPWNLKVLTNNSASILRSLGPVMGVTVPTLHVGMLYSACCWYRDPHGLPWIEYLHTGAKKIWYGIPDEHSEKFKEAMLLLVPRYCRDKKIWLPSDTVMIPPPLLTAENISLSRIVQHPGQFIVVFPKAFTSSISTGYLVSESVYFAHASWLNSARQVFKDMQESCEPSVFSLQQLLISIAEDARTSAVILNKVLPLLTDLQETEGLLRNHLKELGLNACEKMNANKKRKSKSAFSDQDLYECDVCRTNLFISLVENSHDQSYYCLRHAVSLLCEKPVQAKHCKLLYTYTEDDLKALTEKVKSKIEAKSCKKSHAK